MSAPVYGGDGFKEPRERYFADVDRDVDVVYSAGTTFRAGQRPAPGLYRQVDGPRLIEIQEGDYLPASFDGRIAWYRRVDKLWGQLLRRA